MALTAQENLRIEVAATGINRRLYVTPSGEFIELIQDLASQNRVSDIAAAINAYLTAIRTNAPLPFIAGQLPGILTNRVLPHLPGFHYDNFIAHMVSNQADMNAWCDTVRQNAVSPGGLNDAVADLRLRFPR